MQRDYVEGGKTDATVLIYGESGVGKELFAQGIHEASLRKEQPFIPINCGAIPEALLKVNFSAMKRVFTGAHKSGKQGKVEMADGGTLFLDEIGIFAARYASKIIKDIARERSVSDRRKYGHKS